MAADLHNITSPIAKATAAAPTITEADVAGLSLDLSGNLRTLASGGTGTSANQVQGNSAAGATDVGNPVKVGAINSTTLPTLTDGQRGNLQQGTRGALLVTLMAPDSTNSLSVTAQTDTVTNPATGAAYSVRGFSYCFNGSNWDRIRGNTTGIFTLAGGYSSAHITTSTTTTVKSGAGVLHAVIVNTKGTVASTITVYDNTAGSGTVLAIIDSLNLSGTFEFDIAFATGLTLVTTGTVAPDVTVSYR